MKREWIPRDDRFLSEEGKRLAASLRAETGLSDLTIRLCLFRGLNTAAEIHEFLTPKRDTAGPPIARADVDFCFIEEFHVIRLPDLHLCTILQSYP